VKRKPLKPTKDRYEGLKITLNQFQEKLFKEHLKLPLKEIIALKEGILFAEQELKRMENYFRRHPEK
jgi:hypothetical protein